MQTEMRELMGLCCCEISQPREPEQQCDRLAPKGVQTNTMPPPSRSPSGLDPSLRRAKRSLRSVLSITSILIVLSYSVPSIKLAGCYQLISAPARFGQRQQQGLSILPPFDIGSLPTLSSDTAHLLPAELSELPGVQPDWPRKLTLKEPPPSGVSLSKQTLAELSFASPAEQEEGPAEPLRRPDDGSFGLSDQPSLTRTPIQPLVLPRLANLLMAANTQPSALKLLINNTLPQTNLGRAIEATRMFVRQQHETAPPVQPALAPRVPLIQLPGTVSNRLYNFLFQPRAQQLTSQKKSQELSENLVNGKQNASDGALSELIQSAESQDSVLADERPAAGRSLVTLSAPYEERARKSIATQTMREVKASKHVNLMPSASGRLSFATPFARPNSTMTSWRQAASNSSNADELVPNVNHTLMIEAIDAQQSETNQRPQQQFVVGSEESEGGQPEQERQQVSAHLQNQDQANAEFQASLQSSQEEEEANQATQMEQQSAEQPQELAGYIEQPQQQQHMVEQDTGGLPAEFEQENQPVEYGQNESIYLTPGHQRYPSGNPGANMLVPVNETDLNPSSVASLHGDDTSLAAQLPSQYDSMIRLPPDGHYDDYFKPGGAANLNNNEPNNLFASEQLTSGTSSLMSHQDSSNLQPQEFFRSYNLVDTNQSGAQQQQPQSNLGKFNVESNQRQRIQANFQPTVLANNATPIDYTIKYFMNQQPVKPGSQGARGQTIEFATTNQRTISQQELPNHRLNQDSEPQRYMRSKQNRPLAVESASNSTSLSERHYQSQFSSDFNSSIVQRDTSAGGGQLLDEAAGYHLWNSTMSTPTPESNQTEDSIQLIVANSNGFQDPNTNERVITYSSEGRNFTQPNGKSARDTFFNKDLNEIPSDQKSLEPLTNNTNKVQTHEFMLQVRPKLRSTRSPTLDNNPSNPRVVVVLNKHPPQQQQQQQQYRLVATTQPPQVVSTERAGSDADDEDEQGDAYSISEADEQEVMMQPSQFGQFGERQHQQQPMISKDTSQHGRGNHPSQSKSRSQSQRHSGHPREQQHQQGSASKSHRSKTRPQTGGDTDRMHHHHSRFKNSNHAMKQQQTMRRPQITEARFQLQDLPLNSPTAMPSVAESTMKSIEGLPTKVKQIRDKQVDKHELMNELLTALDRVKAAIYKLQPLTAKMNAIYRKSVTSNTRDHIMDHHKGTYSKRYPPGDYDDTYDRMHPSELIDRHRDQQRSSRGRRGDRSRSKSRDELQDSDSKITPVYLPAPRDFKSNSTSRGSPESEFRKRHLPSQGPHHDDAPTESLVVASGFAHRLGPNGQRMRGRLSFRSATGDQQVIYDDDDEDNALGGQFNFDDFKSGKDPAGSDATKQSFSRRNGSQVPDSSGPRALDDQEVQSPLFGYKITIYQSPEDGDSEADGPDGSPSKHNQLLSYTLLSDPTSPELSLNTNADSDPAYGPSDSNKEDSTHEGPTEGLDLMATSESSLAPTQSEEMDAGESSKKKKKMEMGEEKKHKKSMEEEEEHKKKDKKEKGDKKGGKWAKHQERHKKGEEEHKKKKEFKKIKHSKGVMSKESHKLHRDKHIKAHDRGAAKEKALKERTQIEFFEREQIVDDEFEKGKKSTMKAGWASGHDAKKVDKQLHAGGHSADSMSMGGSHYVKHVESPPPDMKTAASEHGDAGYLEKGHGSSMESSSGKQSNKFEKKHMEAKGKKFKGWREKGYKIITETEFIDRGSLHDSAYKKRDKGAAHHQKFKKHEANSEGHHGSMHEHHKKSHKKEEKKSKMEEKKKEMMEKEKGEKAGKHKKAKRKEMGDKKHKHHEEKHKHHGDHDEEESSPTMASIDDASGDQTVYTTDQYNEPTHNADARQEKKYERFNATEPSRMVVGSSTLRPTVLPISMTPTRAALPSTMVRFLPSDHQDQTQHGHMPPALGDGATFAQHNRRDGAHVNTSFDKTNMSRRSSEAGVNTNSATLVDVMNRLRSSQQVSTSETRSEPAKIDFSPLMKLIHGPTRPNNTRNKVDAINQQASILPIGENASIVKNKEPIQNKFGANIAKFDKGNSADSMDRIKLILAQMSQNALREPLRRASNVRENQYNFAPRQVPLSPLGFDLAKPLDGGSGFATNELSPLNAFIPQVEQQVIQAPAFQTRMQSQHESIDAALSHTYPIAPMSRSQQIGGAPNQMDLMNRFETFDFEPDQRGADYRPTFVNQLFDNQRFLHLPFGGNLITQ